MLFNLPVFYYQFASMCFNLEIISVPDLYLYDETTLILTILFIYTFLFVISLLNSLLYFILIFAGLIITIK